MKKLFLSFIIVAMALTACSPPEDSNPDISAVLLKTRIVHNPDGSTITTNFTYAGSKLTTVTTSNGRIINYTYTGNYVTNIQFYEGADLDQENFYTYNSVGQMVEFVSLGYGGGWGSREVYVYNADGTISVTHYSGTVASQTNLTNSGTMSFLANGEIGSVTNSNGNGTSVYTYDTKNFEFKNVTGYDQISYTLSQPNGFNHNVTSMGNDNESYTKTYTYNSAGYPATSSKDFNGEITTTEYFYE